MAAGGGGIAGMTGRESQPAPTPTSATPVTAVVPAAALPHGHVPHQHRARSGSAVLNPADESYAHAAAAAAAATPADSATYPPAAIPRPPHTTVVTTAVPPLRPPVVPPHPQQHTRPQKEQLPGAAAAAATAQPPQKSDAEEFPKTAAVVAGLERAGAFLARGDLVRNLRLGGAAFIAAFSFVAWAATDQGDCRVDLSAWVLSHAMAVAIGVMVCLALCDPVHKLIGKVFDVELGFGRDTRLLLQKASWGVTLLTLLWGVSWVSLMLWNLRRSGRKGCGSAFSGAIAALVVTMLGVVVAVLAALSYATTTTGDDEEGEMLPTRELHPQQNQQHFSFSAGVPGMSAPPTRSGTAATTASNATAATAATGATAATRYQHPRGPRLPPDGQTIVGNGSQNPLADFTDVLQP